MLAGLPDLVVRGLRSGDAADLLESAVPWPLDPRVRDQVLAESHGNPLALTELPRELTATEMAFGGNGVSSPTPPVSRLEQGFMRQLGLLPPQSRHLLLAAASEPVGDATVLWRAAERLGIGADAAIAAEAAGLIELDHRVRFRHPLVRSAAYRSATPAERRQVHRALADVTDPHTDPDRRAWHRAHAVVGTDETVAAELDSAAHRAHSSGGLAAIAAFLGAAAALTPDRARRARRSLDAAQAEATAGAFEEALNLLAVAHAGPLDETGRARMDLLQVQIAYNSSDRDDALPLLLAAARRLEPLDGKRARETYLEALSVAVCSGRLASGPASSLRQVAQAARAATPPTSPGQGRSAARRDRRAVHRGVHGGGAVAAPRGPRVRPRGPHHGRGVPQRLDGGGRGRRPLGRRALGRVEPAASGRHPQGRSPRPAAARAHEPRHLRRLPREPGRRRGPVGGETLGDRGDRRGDQADTHARGVAGRHAGPRRGRRAADPRHRGRRAAPADWARV